MSNYQDENRDECRTTRLDISKYLAELSEELGADEDFSEEQVEVFEEPAENVDDEYSALAKAGEWQKLLELTEGAYSEGSIRTKIWWVASQYHLGLMPAGLLAAPLEAASAAVVDSNNADGLDAETIKTAEDLLIKIGKKLFEENDLELGDTLFQHAIKLNPANSKEYEAELRAHQKLEEEAPATIDSINRLSFIQEKVKELGPTEELDLGKRPSKKGGKLAISLFFIALFASSAFGSYMVLAGTRSHESSKVAYEVLEEQSSHESMLKNPELKPQLVPDSGSLDGILRALKDPSSGHSEERNEATVQEEEMPHDSGVNGDVVNTQGPLEPEIIRQIMSNDTPLEPGIVHEDGIDRVNKPIIGVSDKTKPIVPAYVIPPKTAADSEKMYEIKGFTEIRGEPNMAAPVLEKLITGDRVRVAETFGRWARIVSKGGRDGYIQKSALGREI